MVLFQPLHLGCGLGAWVINLGIVRPPLPSIRQIIDPVVTSSGLRLEHQVAMFSIDGYPAQVLHTVPALDANYHDVLVFGMEIPAPPGKMDLHRRSCHLHSYHCPVISKDIGIPGTNAVPHLFSKQKRRKTSQNQEEPKQGVRFHYHQIVKKVRYDLIQVHHRR